MWLTEPTAGPLVIDESPQLIPLLGTLSGSVSNDDIRVLTRVVVQAYQNGGNDLSALGGMEDLLDAVETLGLRDYEQGNRLAEDVLDAFDIESADRVDIEGLFHRLGIRVGRADVDEPRIRSGCAYGPGDEPLCFINANFRDGDTLQIRRFTLAHEFCHLLFDRGRTKRFALVSSPWAPLDLERRANAFAAALLMPWALLDHAAERTTAEYGTIEWIDDIARRADTSSLATLERLGNLGIVDESDRDHLRLQLSARLT